MLIISLSQYALKFVFMLLYNCVNNVNQHQTRCACHAYMTISPLFLTINKRIILCYNEIRLMIILFPIRKDLLQEPCQVYSEGDKELEYKNISRTTRE